MLSQQIHLNVRRSPGHGSKELLWHQDPSYDLSVHRCRLQAHKIRPTYCWAIERRIGNHKRIQGVRAPPFRMRPFGSYTGTCQRMTSGVFACIARRWMWYLMRQERPRYRQPLRGNHRQKCGPSDPQATHFAGKHATLARKDPWDQGRCHQQVHHTLFPSAWHADSAHPSNDQHRQRSKGKSQLMRTPPVIHLNNPLPRDHPHTRRSAHIQELHQNKSHSHL